MADLLYISKDLLYRSTDPATSTGATFGFSEIQVVDSIYIYQRGTGASVARSVRVSIPGHDITALLESGA
jgi:hypothetical protein